MKLFLRKITSPEWLIVIALALILSVIFTYPSVTFLHSAYIGDGGDNYEYAGYMGLAAHNLMAGMWPFQHSTFWRYPVGFDFQRGFDSYLTIGIGTLLTVLFGLPLSYNLTILLLLAANGVTYYAFFKKLTGSRLLGTIGSLICGFSFYSIARAGGHPNLLFTGCFALFGSALLSILRSERITTKHYVLIFGSLLIAALGSLEYLLIIFMFATIGSILSFIFYRQLTLTTLQKVRVSIVSFLSVSVLTAGTFVLLYFPQLSAMTRGTFVLLNRSNELTALSPSILDYVIPNSYLHLLISPILHTSSTPSIEKLLFLGFIEIPLFILFFIFTKSRKAKLLTGSITFISFALSLGYGVADRFVLLPYHFIANTFPFNAIPEAGRFGLITVFIMTICIVYLLSRITPTHTRRAILIIVILFLVAERIPLQFYKADAFLNDPATRVITNDASKAVLDIPVNPYYARYDVLSVLYDKPIVNGYFHWSADGMTEKSFLTSSQLLDRYMCNASNRLLPLDAENQADSRLLTQLKQLGIQTIVIHKDDKYYHTVCTSVRERLNNLLPDTITMKKAFPVETQLTGTIINGQARLTLFFPQSGTFYLDGAYIAPNKPLTMTLTKDSQPIDFNYTFATDASNALQLLPKYVLQTHVESGTRIILSAPITDATFFYSLWYRYDADPLTPINKLSEPLVKIYDSTKTTVYHVQ